MPPIEAILLPPSGLGGQPPRAASEPGAAPAVGSEGRVYGGVFAAVLTLILRRPPSGDGAPSA